MKRLINLDVLVVQPANLAASATVTDAHSKHPFLLDSKQAHYNQSYEYFLDLCEQSGMKAGLTTSADIIGPGTCSNYWTASLGNWNKIDKRAKSLQIFDKFLPVSPTKVAQRELLLSADDIVPFHDSKLFDIFCDKLLTYQKFSKYAIPTVDVKSAKPADIKLALKKLSLLTANKKYSGDFADKVVLKDRYGASGNFVYKVSKNFTASISKLMLRHQKVSFILQPFVLFDRGFAYKNQPVATDLRLIVHRNKLLQSYIRMAQDGEFRCNEHQGGQLVYVTKQDIPKPILRIAHQLVADINKSRSLYALDFIISNAGNVYFIEGNVGPGIDWDSAKKINEKMSKQLIDNIVNEFAQRLQTS